MIESVPARPGQLPLLLLMIMYFLSLLLSVSGQCGPPPQSGYSFDFTNFGEKTQIGSDGNTYGISPCQNSVYCPLQSFWSAVCMKTPNLYYSIGLSNQRTWSYINGQPSQGAQLNAAGELNYVPSCQSNAPSSSTVKFVCSNPPGDDSITINQLGGDNGGACQWIFSVNSQVVCSQQQTSSSSSSGSSNSSSGSGSGSGGGGGNGEYHHIVIILLIIIILMLFCLLMNRAALT